MAGGFMPGEQGGIPDFLRRRKGPVEEFLSRLALAAPLQQIPAGAMVSQGGLRVPFEIPEDMRATPTRPAATMGSQVQRVTGPNEPTEATLQRPVAILPGPPPPSDVSLPPSPFNIPQPPIAPPAKKPSLQMQDAYDQSYGDQVPKPPLKSALLKSLTELAPIGLGALFGGEAGAAGAAGGVNEYNANQQALREAHRKELLQQIEAQRGREERISEIEAQARNQQAQREAQQAFQTQAATTLFERQQQLAREAREGRPERLPTPDIQDYEYYSKQEQGAGRTPLSFNEWSRERANLRNPPEKQPSEFEATYADFVKDPTLTTKYGPSRIGFDKYKQDQAIQRAIASRPPKGENRPVVSGDAGKIADLDTSLNDLGVLKSQISGPGVTGTRAAIGASLPNVVTDIFGWGTDAKQKQATIDRVKQVIGKALEGGVLRKEDEYKYEKILPTIRDPQAVVQSKLEGLEAAIRQRRSTMLDALEDAGYNVDRYRARRPAPPPASGEGESSAGWSAKVVK